MKSIPSHIQAIVFDAYGTLFDVQKLTQRLALHFGDQAEEINQIWREKQLAYTWLRGLMQRYQPFSTVTIEALRYACQAMQVSLSETAAAELLQGYYQLEAFGSVKQALPQLAQQYQIAVLSNADEQMLEAAVANSGLGSCLTAVLSVNQVGRYKPHPEVYQLAVEQLSLSAEQISFVSSNRWDVAGAKAFGFDVSWLQRGTLPMEELGQKPDRTIHEITELLK